MQIGDVIRKYRKSKGMTQEEMARRLGVSAPAVNKWENGNSMPDILLLSPIARLLGITLDTLVSFQENLTDAEVNRIVEEANERFEREPYSEVFAWAQAQIRAYPNCEHLVLWLAQLLNARRQMADVPDAARYDPDIMALFARVLQSEDEATRTTAADALFFFYVNKKEYEKAERYIPYFSPQNPERKRKQALLCSKTGRMEEAYKAYEELLFSGYQHIQILLQSLYLLAMQEEDLELAHYFVAKLEQAADLFEMGAYHRVSSGLELAAVERDAEAAVTIMEEMLRSVDTLCAFRDARLYRHMTFKAPADAFLQGTKENLLDAFRDPEAFGFLRGNERWRELVKQDES